MTHPTMRQLATELLSEMKSTHHNASFLTVRVKTPDDMTPDEVWEDMQIEGQYALRELEHELSERFNLNWHLAMFGRGGATVAPEDFYTEGMLGCHFTIDLRDYTGLDGYNEARKMLAGLRFVNRSVRDWVRGWAE